MIASDLLYNLVMPNIIGSSPKMDGLQAINSAVFSLTQKLIDYNSDLVKGLMSAQTVVDTQELELPFDCYGFCAAPFIPGFSTIEPIGIDEVSVFDSYAHAVPVKYMVLNTTMHLFPIPDAVYPVKAVYWKMPEAITSLNEEVPYTEGHGALRLESVLALIVMELITSGALSAEFNTAYAAVLESLIMARKPIIPSIRPKQFF